MKQKKKTKAIAIALSLVMAFTCLPFLGTQKAYAVQNNGTVTIDLTKGAQTYEGADAAAIYFFINSAIDNGAITARATGGGSLNRLMLDVNGDYVDDMALNAELSGDSAQSLELRCVDGCSQSGEFALRLSDSAIRDYLAMPDNNDYGLGHFYDTLRIEFPEITYVEILDPNGLIIPLDDGMKQYFGAQAAAINTLLMDSNCQTNDGTKIRRDKITDNTDYTAYNLFLDKDNDPDVYATFIYNDNGVCTSASFELLSGYYDYDTILVYLPPARMQYYGSLRVPNEFGVEYMYTCLMFDARDYGTVSIKDEEVELSAKSYNYNGKVQKPNIIKIGGLELTEGDDYTAKWSNESSTNAGTYTVTITGTGNYRGTTEATYQINKANNPLSVNAKKATVKYKSVKKKARTLTVDKVMSFTKKGQGALTYTKVSGNKKITIAKTTGKVTLKKRIKRGTYSVKVNIRAAGNANYKAITKTVTFKVKVK